ncbi:penicillin-binding transpeptidase domain-containing protein [Nonomuraea sp. LPB2021202275-12-8]|uniref:penicillin-binding transpeptidase domain-containing protein n=1 Tax=Nonomuraea sp. LPB2021202275-12-8 TaxID=3120159 RepID=UPI00300C9775
MLFVLLAHITFIQAFASKGRSADPRNERTLIARFDQPRGAIVTFDGTTVAASRETGGGPYRYRRFYPHGEMYAPITGYVAPRRTTGIERAEEIVLSGRDPKVKVRSLVRDGTSQAADVRLTISERAQRAAYQGLKSARVPGAAVAINPATGAILALATWPSYDPNAYTTFDRAERARTDQRLRRDPAGPLLNRALDRTYPAGSASKLVMAAAALASGEYAPTTVLPAPPRLHLPPAHRDQAIPDAPAGGREHGGPDAHRGPADRPAAVRQDPAGGLRPDASGGAARVRPDLAGRAGGDRMGPGGSDEVRPDLGGRPCGNSGLTLAQAFQASCDAAFAGIGLRLGQDTLRDQAEAFGFNRDDLAIPLPAAASTFPASLDRSGAALSAVGGPGIRVTPLMVAMLSAAVANGGTLMHPYLVEEVRLPGGLAINRAGPSPYRTALSPALAEQLTSMMTTGPRPGGRGTAAARQGALRSAAAVPDKAPAAWGASAMRTSAKGMFAMGMPVRGRPVTPTPAIFTAFAPARAPEVAVGVVLERPGPVAAIARAILQAALA